MYQNSSLFVFYNWFNLTPKLSVLQTAEINLLSSLFQGEKKEAVLNSHSSAIEIPYQSQFSTF